MAGIVAWSAMTAACGLARDYWHLVVARMGVGIGEATLSLSAYSIIADYFRPHRLGLAIRVFGVGSAAGSGIALIIGGAVVNITTSIEHTELPVLDQVHGWGLVFLMIGLRQASADASV